MSLSISNRIQIFIAVSTFLAVIVALFGERIRWRLYGPRIVVEFDRENERCFRWVKVSTDMLQDQGAFTNVKRQCFRLRIFNQGHTTACQLKAKIELYSPNKGLADRFEPSNLQWISGLEIVDLAPKEDEYLNLISQVMEIEDVKYKLRIELANKTPRGIAWDRTLDSWILKISIHGENIYVPIVKFFRFEPAREKNQPGNLEEVRLKACNDDYLTQ